MPSGKSQRMFDTASRTSFTTRSIGVPIVNWTNVFDTPSRTDELISSTPDIPRTAASIFCVTCVSSSVGAAPGCDTEICAAGKSISGSRLTCIRLKLTSPASVNAMNSTIGATGLRIAQAEMLRNDMGDALTRRHAERYRRRFTAWRAAGRRFPPG